jgi:hypothetical protein
VLAIDYSFARPTPAAIKAAGVSGVMRYLGGSRNKDLTAGEAADLLAQGLWIGLNWESSAQRVNVGGMAGGLDDAHSANAQADQIGAPHDAVIFYSCDTNPNLGAARQYFQGREVRRWPPDRLVRRDAGRLAARARRPGPVRVGGERRLLVRLQSLE